MPKHKFFRILRWTKGSQEVLCSAVERKTITPEGVVALLPLRARRDPKELNTVLPQLAEFLGSLDISIVRAEAVQEAAPRKRRESQTAQGETAGENDLEQIVEEGTRGSVSENQLLGIYVKDVRQYPIFSREDIAIWANLARKNKDKKAQDVLVCGNLRLVFRFVREFLGRGLPYLDLIQTGNLGLMRAAELYDERKGYRFSTYASWWIRQKLYRAVEDEARFIRLPSNVHDELRRILKAKYQLEAEFGGEATPTTIARRIRMPVERVRERMLLLGFRLRSFDDLFVFRDEDGPADKVVSSVGEMTRDTRRLTPLESCEAKDELNAAYLRLEKLVERALSLGGATREFVFRVRYGLDGTFEPKAFSAIGKRFQVSRQHICQINERVLGKLHIRKAYLGEEIERILMLEDLVGEEAFALRKRLAIPPFIFRNRLPPDPRKTRTS